MSELASADTLVLSVSAIDRDSGPNGKITYRLLSSPLQGFYIEPDDGERGMTDGKTLPATLSCLCLTDSKPSLSLCLC